MDIISRFLNNDNLNINDEHTIILTNTIISLISFMVLDLLLVLTLNFKTIERYNMVQGKINMVVCFLIINVFILYFIVKLIIKFWKRKYFLIIINNIAVTILPLLSIIFILSFFIIKWIALYLGFEIFKDYMHFYNMWNSITMNYTLDALFLSIIVFGLSLTVNSIFTGEYQLVKCYRKSRIIIKTSIIVALSLFIVALSNSNRTYISIITAVNTVFVFICTPENILTMFSSNKVVEKKDIDESFNKNITLIKLYIYEIYISWLIVIVYFNYPKYIKHTFLIKYIYEYCDNNIKSFKIVMIIFVFFIMAIITAIIQNSKTVNNYFDKFIQINKRK